MPQICSIINILILPRKFFNTFILWIEPLPICSPHMEVFSHHCFTNYCMDKSTICLVPMINIFNMFWYLAKKTDETISNNLFIQIQSPSSQTITKSLHILMSWKWINSILTVIVVIKPFDGHKSIYLPFDVIDVEFRCRSRRMTWGLARSRWP